TGNAPISPDVSVISVVSAFPFTLRVDGTAFLACSTVSVKPRFLRKQLHIVKSAKIRLICDKRGN
ncbi:hypothetical protein ACK1LK_003092, partial [Salmonella enterica]